MELSLDIWLITYLALVYLTAGLVKGTVGVGMPTVVMGLATLAIDPRLSIVLLLWPILIANFWQVWRSGQTKATLKRYRWFILMLVPTVAVSVFFAANAPDNLLYGIAGLAILSFVAVEVAFKPPRIPARFDTAAQLSFGTIAGVLGGLQQTWEIRLVHRPQLHCHGPRVSWAWSQGHDFADFRALLRARPQLCL